jgi:transcriptional regulator with XRE-family HTH domain
MAGSPTPRQVLAANLKELLQIHELTAPTVAKRAGIDPKSMNNMLNARFEPRRENVDAVAKVFGLTGWQLIRKNLTKDMPKAAEIEKLIERYTEATPEQRETIMKVADMSATYKTKK